MADRDLIPPLGPKFTPGTSNKPKSFDDIIDGAGRAKLNGANLNEAVLNDANLEPAIAEQEAGDRPFNKYIIVDTETNRPLTHCADDLQGDWPTNDTPKEKSDSPLGSMCADEYSYLPKDTEYFTNGGTPDQLTPIVADAEAGYGSNPERWDYILRKSFDVYDSFSSLTFGERRPPSLLERLQASEPPPPDELREMTRKAIADSEARPKTEITDDQVDRVLAAMREEPSPTGGMHATIGCRPIMNFGGKQEKWIGRGGRGVSEAFQLTEPDPKEIESNDPQIKALLDQGFVFFSNYASSDPGASLAKRLAGLSENDYRLTKAYDMSGNPLSYQSVALWVQKEVKERLNARNPFCEVKEISLTGLPETGSVSGPQDEMPYLLEFGDKPTKIVADLVLVEAPKITVDPKVLAKYTERLAAHLGDLQSKVIGTPSSDKLDAMIQTALDRVEIDAEKGGIVGDKLRDLRAALSKSEPVINLKK